MARKPAKGPGGRPTDYRPEFCERVEALMSEGFSKMAAAGDCGVSYQTLKNWTEAHPEFLAAVKRGEAKRTMKLERDLLMAETGPQVTSRIFALKNAAPEEWRDMKAVEMSGKDGGPIQTEDVTRDAESFTRRISSLAAAHAGAGDGEADAGSEGGA